MKKVFKGIIKVYFWVGVNVIGLPDIHVHQIAKYKYENGQPLKSRYF